jgi:uncharacterized protein (DUF1697 family)
MPGLRAALDEAGFGEVKTYVQSGNIVLTSKASPDRVVQRVRALIKKEFGHDIAVIVRSHAELKAVVKRNPLAKVARNPKRYLVTFLGLLLPATTGRSRWWPSDERFAVTARRSLLAPLASAVAAMGEARYGLGVTATSRNWDTVTTCWRCRRRGAR